MTFLPNLLLGFSGLIPAFLLRRFLKTIGFKTTLSQKLLVALIALTPFLVFLFWGILHVGFERGGAVPLISHVWELSNWISDSLGIICIVILPVITFIWMILLLKHKDWKYILVPLVVSGSLVILNIGQVIQYFHQDSPLKSYGCEYIPPDPVNPGALNGVACLD
jgi:hypothetical protein